MWLMRVRDQGEWRTIADLVVFPLLAEAEAR
jgi:hypothetical protein